MGSGRTRLRVVRSGDGVDAAAVARELESPTWLTTTKVLKRDAGSWVRRATLAGRDVVVKASAYRLSDRIKSAVGQTRAQRQWDGAERLASKNIPVAQSLALLRGTFEGLICELLVYEYVPGPTLLEGLAGPEWLTRGTRFQHEIADAAGRSVIDLRHHALFNRDHKPSNLIVSGWPAEPLIVILDTVAIRTDRSLDATARMLASLFIEPTGVGLAPRLRRSLLYRAVDAAADHDRDQTRQLYRAAAAIVREHGDPSPNVNPLG